MQRCAGAWWVVALKSCTPDLQPNVTFITLEEAAKRDSAMTELMLQLGGFVQHLTFIEGLDAWTICLKTDSASLMGLAVFPVAVGQGIRTFHSTLNTDEKAILLGNRKQGKRIPAFK
jgi:hypothetical protein